MATMNSGLGGPAGYGEGVFTTSPNLVGGIDDGSVSVDISSVFGGTGLNYFGADYSSLYVNSNGSISFGSPNMSYSGSLDSQGVPTIAPFLSDHNLNNGGEIYYDLDPTAGTVTITWLNVAPFSGTGTNSYQVVLTDTGSGDFEVDFIYEDIQWTNGGSGSAVTGLTSGNGVGVELEGSGNDTALLNYESNDFDGGDGLGQIQISFEGGSPDQNILGSSSNDVIDIDAGFLDANGNILSNAGNQINAGAGDDVVTAGFGADLVSGGTGNDTIDGGLGSDTLSGDDGDDVLNAGIGGNDVLYGGSGNDVLYAGFADDVLYGDRIQIDPAEHASTGGAATNLTVTNGADGPIQVWWIDYSGVPVQYATLTSGQSLYVTTNADNNWLVRDENGNDLQLIEGSNNDTIVYGAGGLNDTIDASGGSFNTIFAGYGDDSVIGGSNKDTIDGESGDDIIDGGDGDDIISGGAGSDTILSGGTAGGGAALTIVNNGDNLIGTTGQDGYSWAGGAGNFTTIRFNDSPDAGDGDGIADFVVVTNTDNSGTLTIGDFDVGTDKIYIQETWTGISSSASSGYQSYTLTYANGNQQTFDFYHDNSTGVSASAVFSTDPPPSLSSGDGGSDLLSGDADADTFIISDGFGADTITGGEGVSTGTDTDLLNLANLSSGATVTYSGNEAGTVTDGSDTLNFSEIETLALTAQADSVDGSLSSSGVNLDGAGGNDILTGGSGADTLSGGDGDDLIDGGAGNDFLTTGLGQDTLIGGTGDDTLMNSDGDDSLVGGDGDDSIVATGGQDTLRGGTGADTMDGGNDADTFIIEDGFGNDVITGGEGTTDPSDSDFDVIDLSAVTGPVTVTYSSTGAESGTITDGTDTITFSEIEQIILTDQNDSVDGSASHTGLGGDAPGINVEGRGGDDTILGGRGGDTIDGGTGADSIVGDYGDDRISGGTGNDTIFGDDPAGSGQGNDTVDGGDGDDYIDGGLQSDTLGGGDGNDTILGGEGNDLLEGGAGADSLQGGDGDDFFDYAVGGDTQEGGAGNDTLRGGFDAGSDDAILDGGSGDDEIVTYGANDTIYGGTGNDTVVGDSGDEYIDGGADDDTIWGSGGDDTIIGGTGDDSIEGGSGNNTFVYAVGDGNDTITGFNSGNTGTLNDGDSTNNDYIDLSSYYDNLQEIYADQADDGVLNQSNTTDAKGRSVDYSDNAQFGANDSLTFQGASADNSSFTVENTGVVCFAAGTAIRTPLGDILIDDLNVGDLVTTLDNGPQRIRWIGTSSFGAQALAQTPGLRPILINRGVMGAERNLLVSRQHGMLIGRSGHNLARAVHLAKTTPGIRIAHGKREITYFHIMFEQHQIILAENVPSESFYPGPMAMKMMSQEARHTLIKTLPNLLNAYKRCDTVSHYGNPARCFIAKKELSLMAVHRMAL